MGAALLGEQEGSVGDDRLDACLSCGRERLADQLQMPASDEKQ
jgi:hypothetical protein